MFQFNKLYLFLQIKLICAPLVLDSIKKQPQMNWLTQQNTSVTITLVTIWNTFHIICIQFVCCNMLRSAKQTNERTWKKKVATNYQWRLHMNTMWVTEARNENLWRRNETIFDPENELVSKMKRTKRNFVYAIGTIWSKKEKHRWFISICWLINLG